KLKGDGLVVIGSSGSLQFQAQLLKLDGKELDGHIPVETLSIGPALETELIGHLFIDLEKVFQFVIIDMSILKGHRIHSAVKSVEGLAPLLLVLSQGTRFFS